MPCRDGDPSCLGSHLFEDWDASALLCASPSPERAVRADPPHRLAAVLNGRSTQPKGGILGTCNHLQVMGWIENTERSRQDRAVTIIPLALAPDGAILLESASHPLARCNVLP